MMPLVLASSSKYRRELMEAESLGIALMESVESADPTAIIGLPLIALTRMLANEEIEVV